MVESSGRIRPVNPLSTSCVRPGALAYQFAPGPRLEQLLERLRDTAGWGQIIGPHGSGKSTLVRTLLPRLPDIGLRPFVFDLHDRQRRMPTGWQQLSSGPRDVRPVVVVDGYEQLSVLARWKLRRTCGSRDWGLVVTAHRSMGFPMLYRTHTTSVLAEALVQQLFDDRAISIPSSQIQDSFQRHRGNMRDVFMELFDRYENLRR